MAKLATVVQKIAERENFVMVLERSSSVVYGQAGARHHQRSHPHLQFAVERRRRSNVPLGLAAPLDVPAIERVLPHRFPFLLIDRVIELGEDKVVALKNVSANEPYFAGHFPGHPIMPGVLQVEAMAQAGAVLALNLMADPGERPLVFFMGIDKVKFRKPVVPGDQLRLEVEPLRKGGAIWKMAGRALVDGNVVSEAEFLATFKK